MSFTYKGIHASEMGLEVASELEFAAPERRMDLVPVPGRDGILAIDNGGYMTVSQRIPCHLKLPAGIGFEEALTEIHNWLHFDGWHDFIWDDDPDFIHRAMVHERYSTTRFLRHYGKMVANFRLHPIKYHRNQLIERQINTGHVVDNPTSVPAKPRFRIVGTGNVTLNIGSQRLELASIQNGITVDCEDMTVVMQNGATAFSHMRTLEFPTLPPGRTAITWTGNFRVYIIPRLGALI